MTKDLMIAAAIFTAGLIIFLCSVAGSNRPTGNPEKEAPVIPRTKPKLRIVK